MCFSGPREADLRQDEAFFVMRLVGRLVYRTCITKQGQSLTSRFPAMPSILDHNVPREIVATIFQEA